MAGGIEALPLVAARWILASSLLVRQFGALIVKI
jgi:hypothetical protein